MDENKIFCNFQENFIEFQNNIKEIFNNLSITKNIENQNEIKDLIKIESKIDLFYEFLYFFNYRKWISVNIDFNNEVKNNISNYIINISIFNDKTDLNKSSYKIILHIYIFLLTKIEKIIALKTSDLGNYYIKNEKFEEINQSFLILIQIFLFILKLYSKDIYNINQIFLFFNILIIFINKVGFNNDKYIKLKNIIFLKLLIDNYFAYFLEFIFFYQDNKKDDIILLIDYIVNIFNNLEIGYCYNFQIIIKYKLIEKIIQILLNNIDYNKNIDIYNKITDTMINCFANIYKNNTKQSYFFQTLIIQNKKSFINLVNYKSRKDLIIKDLYIQNFYIELLYKIFSYEKKNDIQGIKNEKAYFVFNGYNSKMSFKLNGFTLNNSLLLFSFQLFDDNPNTINNESNILPLLYFKSQTGKEDIFKIYIKKENNSNKLFISQEKDENKKKAISIEKLGNIYSSIQNFLAIKFTNKKLQIFLKSYEKYYEEIEIYDINNRENISPILIIGYDDKNNEYFKGYIGTFIAINNLSIRKKCNIEQIINEIFKLKNLYVYFPFFFCESSLYNFDEKIYFSSSKEENEFNKIKIFLKENIENLECDICLNPVIFGIYNSLVLKGENREKFILPKIPNIIKVKDYNIINMNISIVKFSSISIDFLNNNGLDYFILIYEYFYHFYKLIDKDIEEFDFYLNSINLKNIIIKIINTSLLIIFDNYTYYKQISSNPKKYKTLFRNLYEILKSNNNRIFFGIYKELYRLYFNFFNELNSLENSINNNVEDLYLLDTEKIILPFSNGLMDMIFDIELYKNYEEENNIIMLFQFIKKIIIDYNNDNNPFKVFPLGQSFVSKIMGFVKIFEKEFTNDVKNQKKIVYNYFDLIKEYLEVFDNQRIKQNYFKQFFIYILKHYEGNLTIILNILHFIYEMLWKNFYLTNEDIELLKKFCKQKNIGEDNSNKKLIEDIEIFMFRILVKASFSQNSKEVVSKLSSKLKEIINNEIIFTNIILELTKIFENISGYSQINNREIKSKFTLKVNYMELYESIFDFIFNLLDLVIKKNENILGGEDIENFGNNLENDKFLKLLYILENLRKILSRDIEKNRNNIHCIYCLINFLKFFFRAISIKSKILLCYEIKVIQILIEVLILCKQYYLINLPHLFTIKYDTTKFHKTIIEIIYDIAINYFLNDANSEECYILLLENYNSIFYDNQLIDNKNYSIFYANDYLNYCINKKKNKELNNKLDNKYYILNFYNNEIFINEDKITYNFTTYFLSIIISTIKIINNKNKYNKALIPNLLNFLNILFSSILNEHKYLYITDKKYFFKMTTSIHYNEIINYIKENHIKKKVAFNDVKNNIDFLSEKWRKEKSKELINIRENIEENELVFEVIQSEELVMNNNIQFFYDLDKYYITNIKKEIMNCIFSIYYIDEFFYSKDFCTLKKYYKNNYLNNSKLINYTYSKKLNFPSIIKNYRNNFEAPLFIKKFNNFLLDPFFPITHSYIKDGSLKKVLNFQKSIKLYQKEFYYFENDKYVECEMLKNEIPFYGKLYYNDSKNYLIFKEETNNFKGEEGYKHIFLVKYTTENNISNIIPKITFNKKIYKNILIAFDEIEEIIEYRILLLWKGFEIYLKNGKSYIFNFLTTKEYNNFMESFILKSEIKHLVKKRNYFSDNNIITEIWRKGLLSNYDYILILNRYSSRSFNDPTQYPIFPWLLNNYKDLQSFIKNEKHYFKIRNEYFKLSEKEKELYNTKSSINNNKLTNIIKSLFPDESKDNNKNVKINNIVYKNYIKEGKKIIDILLRDFKYPPAFQSIENKNRGKVKYEDEEYNESKFPSHTGTHYSNVGYTYFYLMRQQPYDNLLVKVQGYNLENPNRVFTSIVSLQKIIQIGYDNRELIPEFFSKIEYFLNLNCNLYGNESLNNELIDDCEIESQTNNDIKDKKLYISKYVNFILLHKKLLNSKLIGFYLNDWIDNIFGINQLPINNRKESYNIFHKLSYEQATNLEEKLEKKIKKINLTEKLIKRNFKTKIDHILNFGVVPHILFNKPHPKLKCIIMDDNKKENYEKEKNISSKINNNKINENFDSNLIDSISHNQLYSIIKGNPIFFKINPKLNKIFVYNDEDDLTILDCTLFNETNNNYFHNYFTLKANILFSKENSEYQIKYSFASFNNENKYKDNEVDNYHTYYYNKINSLFNCDTVLNKIDKCKSDQIKIITCRHIDFSFKIHYLEKVTKNKKKENHYKIYSFICEDFVTSCYCISNNAFVVGLNNGRLIYYIIKEYPNFNNNKKNIKQKDIIKIERKMYIQAHIGKINMIEIDKRLGLVITSADDNYILIRKLYDFELLLPIKIKNKYIILMAKISSYNFLYILCFNKIKKLKVIFGYTLSGMKFAKSEYGSYDNINFNEDGNIITIENKKNIIILSGNDLSKMKISDDKKIINALKEIKYTNWIQFDYYLRIKEEDSNKIVTFFENRDGNNLIRSLIINTNFH